METQRRIPAPPTLAPSGRATISRCAWRRPTGPALAAWALACLAAHPVVATEAPSLPALTAELRDANYAADAAATERLRDAFRALAADSTRADRAHAYYQAGTASGLLAAFVGPGSLANRQGDVPAMVSRLEEAAADLERAVALDPGLAEAHAALAMNYAMRVPLQRDRAADLAARAKAARERSLELAPRNPRVVVSHAGFLFWAPAEAGGDRDRGLARYRESLELFAAEPAAQRERYAWGEPDAWAFLALAEMMRQPPDLAAARAALDRAVALRPDFAWALGVVGPALERAAAAAKEEAAGSEVASGSDGN